MNAQSLNQEFNPSRLCLAIRRAVVASGKSQAQIARESGMQPYQVSKFLNCRAGMNSTNIDRIMIALGMRSAPPSQLRLAINLALARAGMTQSHLSQISGVAESKISVFLSGHHGLHSENLDRILTALMMI